MDRHAPLAMTLYGLRAQCLLREQWSRGLLGRSALHRHPEPRLAAWRSIPGRHTMDRRPTLEMTGLDVVLELAGVGAGGNVLATVPAGTVKPRLGREHACNKEEQVMAKPTVRAGGGWLGFLPAAIVGAVGVLNWVVTGPRHFPVGMAAFAAVLGFAEWLERAVTPQVKRWSQGRTPERHWSIVSSVGLGMSATLLIAVKQLGVGHPWLTRLAVHR